MKMKYVIGVVLLITSVAFGQNYSVEGHVVTQRLNHVQSEKHQIDGMMHIPEIRKSYTSNYSLDGMFWFDNMGKSLCYHTPNEPSGKSEIEGIEVPRVFKLYPCYPNPFNPATTVSFDLPKPQNVIIEIYNVLGEKIRSITNTTYEAGTYDIVWDGRNNNGSLVTSGIYFCKLTSENYNDSIKMTLLK